MKITETSGEITLMERYAMTKSPEIQSVQHVQDGSKLIVLKWLHFDDTNADGEIAHMLSILGANEDGEETIWSTQSDTFKNEFSDIVDMCVDEGFESGFTIKKLSGETKAGRTFHTCALCGLPE